MPKGEPSRQSIATRKYEAKAGWMAKTYKMKREVVEAFAEACDRAGCSQAGKLMELMRGFIAEVDAAGDNKEE